MQLIAHVDGARAVEVPVATEPSRNTPSSAYKFT
jgi:hypothetical protein